MIRWPFRSPGGAVLAVAAPAAALLCSADVGFRDAGELGGAAAVLGVAHPTGFAADMLVLHGATLLPFGPLAFRQNLVTALIAAGVLALLADLLGRLARSHGGSPWPAVVGAVPTFAFWSTFQQSALVVEVYSSALFALGLALLAACRGAPGLGALCVWLGLAVGLHAMVGPLVGLLVAITLARLPATRRVASVRAHVPLALAGAGILAYLPLASRRDPPFDWGDPETLGALLDHITGARIRQAYSSAMLGGTEHAVGQLGLQLGELWPLLPVAIVGALLLARRARPVAVLALAMLSIDLAYAVWINPMGIPDRQVGHLSGAVLCFLAGAGLVLSVPLGSGAGRRTAAWLVAVGLLAASVLRDAGQARADPLVASELHGGGGALSELPPRGLVVCWEDDQCAAALFARYAEGVRPDLDVVPAQHLWDPTVRVRTAILAPGMTPAPPARASTAFDAVRQLAAPGGPRPVLWSSSDPLSRARVGAPPHVSAWPPLLTYEPTLAADDDQDVLARLDAALKRRGPPPRTERGRRAWSAAYGNLGETWLRGGRPGVALVALQRATEVAPARSVAWSNLGVAYESVGRVDDAVAATQRAVELEPDRPTPWVNLARLQLERRGDAAAARAVLELAMRAGVEDPRLAALGARLSSQR